MNIKFGISLNCIDGRVQIPVIKWMEENFGVDYVDSITEPGMDKLLSHGQLTEIEKIKEKVIISITAHDSTVVAVVGHYDCAGNPVSKQQHYQDIVESTERVKSWGLPVKVVGLWVDQFWCVHVVSE